MSDRPRTQDHLSASSSVSKSSSTPSFVDHIDLNSIASLATAVRSRTTLSDDSVACTVNSTPKAGSYNVVWFIDFEDNVQWVIRIPKDEWSPMMEKGLRSDIITMKLIQSRTSIPIPPIHDFSVDTKNVIGRPYILMDRVKGIQLCKLWFDQKWFTEERRKNVFRSLVFNMMQLRTLEFPAIGCLDYDPKTDSHIVGPLLTSTDEIEDGGTSTRGPYNTVHAYLLDDISRQVSEDPSMDHKISLSLLRLFAGALPDESLDGPPFVLHMPDFNYQNIFVDEEGHVTGLIDWDGTQTSPRQGGYARYPSWITRDWDPLMYGYPRTRTQDDVLSEQEDEMSSNQEEEDSGVIATSIDPSIPSREELQEDSPEVLQAFREEYLRAFEEADPVSANYTRNSHVYEAIEIAIDSPFLRFGITCRLMDYVFGCRRPGDELSILLLEEGLRAGDWLSQPK
ncbi:hypothetical protein J132_04506 [Termitomyces sp. J132]|nr:hypothetical protein H2248_005796 [Termitomyces sp. 'cryptogamus']KNZ77687.1 hypothetical protein J132_04506 [Termitomyces sp. J132]